ncbi:MAG: hypothetical protein MUP82_10205 [Candidatus Marinimicrobia bacterium]|nr:hypothetical protein [Candidatus Neomarinimicrobiota bacterium]
MKSFQLISKRKLKGSTLLLLLVVFLGISNVFGSKPNISISSSALYPRLSMTDTEEQTHWRSILSYDQKFGSKLGIDGFFEYGSENDHFRNPLRVHHLTADLNLGNHELSIGRIAIWNALQNARVDGARLDINTKKLGTLSFVGGFKAIINFSDSLFTNNTYFMGSWSKGRIGKNISASLWMKGDTKDIHPFVGLYFNTSKFSIRISNALAFDIGETKLNYARIRLSKRLGNHTIGLGFRQKRFEYFNQFETLSDKISIAPTITFDVNSLMSEKLLWRNQLSYRLAEEGKGFLVSSVNYKKIQASFLGGLEGDNKMFGLILGATHRLSGPLSFGGSVALNALDYGDFADLKSSSGAYGWVGWQPKDFIMLKLYGRFSTNPYFEQDGRGGIIINVAF